MLLLSLMSMATSEKEEEECDLKVSALRFLSDYNLMESIERQCTSLLTTSGTEVSEDYIYFNFLLQRDPQRMTVYKITLVIDTLCLLEASGNRSNH